MGKGNSKCDLVKENVDKMMCKKACQSCHMGDQQAGMPESWGHREEGEEAD